MDHALWRKYDSSSGRWTTADPYTGSINIGDPQSFNRYSYVESDPVNRVDPSGLEESWNCYVDGIQVSCGFALQLFANGAAEFRPPGSYFHQGQWIYQDRRLSSYNDALRALGYNALRSMFGVGDGERVRLSGDRLSRFRNERDRLVKLLKDKNSNCSKFLKEKLGVSGSRVARTVLGQRPFDATLTTASLGKAGLDRQHGLFGDSSVQGFFAELGTRAGTAVYATPDDGGATPRDVYYAPSGLNASTILHESLHILLGGNITDPQLAAMLGADFENVPFTIDTALADAGCK